MFMYGKVKEIWNVAELPHRFFCTPGNGLNFDVLAYTITGSSSAKPQSATRGLGEITGAHVTSL